MHQSIYKIRTIFLLLLMMLFSTSATIKAVKINEITAVKENSLYNDLQLGTIGLSKKIFEMAVTKWTLITQKLNIEKTNILSIVDLSQSSNSKRLYIIDIENKKILFNTYVAHGRNSGEEFATHFSNKLNSFQSSLGFYVTTNTYQGAHGLSLKLKGIEKGINDIAENRGIVLHGASYVSESFINNFGRLGRSQGCPAVSEELCIPIINSIKGGTCFFMFYPDKNYLKKSTLI